GLRGLAAALLAGLLLGRPAPGPHLEVTVLDVGQGLAVVLRAGERTLVYDTGPAFSDSFDAGSGIVAPYLRSLGVRAIDLLVISHGDNDHAGGARELARAMPVRRTVAAAGAVPELDAEPCVAGGRWRWEGVEFTLLSPPAGGAGERQQRLLRAAGAPRRSGDPPARGYRAGGGGAPRRHLAGCPGGRHRPVAGAPPRQQDLVVDGLHPLGQA